jgi:aspartyl-tRNA(Asn)/glutamyl-tRNA(Gln) amidotransferase subunit A
LDVLRAFATLEDVTLPELPYQAAIVTIIRAEASAAFDDFITQGKPAELTAEADRVTPYIYDTVSARDYLRAMRIRRHISRAMDELCARYDALVSPTLQGVAPAAGESFANVFRRRGPQIGAAGNLAGLPAVSVPNGFGERGLPTALQFVGRAWAENRVLAVAHAYQQHTDWHLRLPPLLGL